MIRHTVAFREAVATGEQPETSAADNINSLAIVLGCVESIERGEAVSLEGVETEPDIEAERIE